MIRLATSILLILMCSVFLMSQNIGIGTSDPSEKLEVSGMIYTNQGGIKFPDETVQTTAAFNMPAETHPILRGAGFGKFYAADLDGNTDTLGMTKTSIIYGFDVTAEINGTNEVFTNVTIVKQTDKGSPGFYKYLLNDTTAPTIEINLTRPNSSGVLEVYYRFKMTNVKVASITPQLLPAIDGYYVNTDRIELLPTTLTLYDIPSGKCYCWNIQTSSSCTCP